MSPEEFDNRLQSAFKDEYYPPKEQLWANISSKLEPKAKTPFWNWLLPALLAVTVGVTWLVLDLKPSEKPLANQTENHSELIEQNSSSHTESSNAVRQESLAPKTHTESSASKPALASNIDNTVNSNHSKSHSIAVSNYAFDPASQANKRNTVKPSDNILANALNMLDAESNFINNFNWLWFPRFMKTLGLETLNSIALLENNSTAKDQTVPRKPIKTSDFTSKRWFTIGLGPQLALNSIKMNQDSQAWVHKHLWDNRNRLTSNGSGFQAFAHMALKFGKKQRFIFETGLNYSIRTEDIKLNESSFDIAARDNTGKINQYTQILLKVIYGTDTTYYLAASNFSLAVNNKYHILTLPFNLSAEQKISDLTYISYGLGGGFSMLSSHNTEHLNMIWGNTVKESNSTQFSASLNAKIAMYTNFNDIGQIGIYTGMQMYLNPWKVNSNQYAINMRDLQMGITFRKPF